MGMKIIGKTPKLLARLLLYAWCFFSIYALVWIAISSLKTNREFFRNAWGLFAAPQWSNYSMIWGQYSLGGYFGNSLYVVTLSVILILIVSTPAAYVLSRVKFFGVKQVGLFIILGMGIPVHLLLVPLYFMLNDMGLINSLNGLILINAALSIPFSVFLEMGFFRTLPSALAEAAEIDGCKPILTFFKIMLPLGLPGVITAAIFNFISLWNDFLLPLTMLNDDKLFTIPVGLNNVQSSLQYNGQWTALFAGLLMVILPTLLIYLVLSKQIIAGLTMGAVKD